MDRLVALVEDQARDIHFRQVILEELITAKLHNPFCAKIHPRIYWGHSTPFRSDYNGVLVRTKNSNAEIVVPYSLKQRVLSLSHCSVPSSHLGGR